MRQEFMTYAFLSEKDREVNALPALDASVEELDVFWNAVYAARGEQPETLALPKPGALRGDAPLSNPEKEIK